MILTNLCFELDDNQIQKTKNGLPEFEWFCWIQNSCNSEIAVRFMFEKS